MIFRFSVFQAAHRANQVFRTAFDLNNGSFLNTLLHYPWQFTHEYPSNRSIICCQCRPHTRQM